MSYQANHSQAIDRNGSSELEEFRAVFSLFDQDGSGAIATQELAQAVAALGVDASDKVLKKWMDEIDADGNGEIDFDEFCQCMRDMSEKQQTDDEIVRKCYLVFDSELTGSISEESFRHTLITLGCFTSEQARELFSEVDVDNNGRVDYEEFEQMVKRYLLCDVE